MELLKWNRPTPGFGLHVMLITVLVAVGAPVCTALAQNPESTNHWFDAQPTATPYTLDLNAAIELAIRNDPVSQQIGWEIEQESGDRHQATRLPNPVASITGDEIGNEGSTGQYGVQWSQDVVRSDRLGRQGQYYDARIGALQHKLEVRRWQIIVQTTSRFLEVCRRRQELADLEDQQQQLSDLEKIVDALFSVGEISQVDQASIKIETRLLEQEIAELRLSIDAQKRALAIPLGLDAGGSGAAADLQFDWKTAVREVLQVSPEPDAGWETRHPQRAFAAARAERERIGIGVARTEQCPDVQVAGSLNYDFATNDTFVGFEIGVPLLRNDNKSGLIHSATARYCEAMEQLRQVELQLREQMALRAGEVARYQSRVRTLKETVIPAAESNFQQIQAVFKQGATSYLTLKSGFETVAQSRQRLVEAEYELILARARQNHLLLGEDLNGGLDD